MRKDNQTASAPEKRTAKKHSKQQQQQQQQKIVLLMRSILITVIILGDSIIKNLNGREMPKTINNPGCKIYVKHLLGAKENCMKDNCITRLQHLHGPEIIANTLINLGLSL